MFKGRKSLFNWAADRRHCEHIAETQVANNGTPHHTAFFISTGKICSQRNGRPCQPRQWIELLTKAGDDLTHVEHKDEIDRNQSGELLTVFYNQLETTEMIIQVTV